jgi:hydroxymethylpyrimidine pyrophosphatase-like HAD family hydrolase
VNEAGLGWVGVDLDGTLADHDDNWDGGIGKPIEHMVARVKRWLAAGVTVRILTARVHPDWDQDHKHLDAIQDWCVAIFGQRLAVTCMKDPNMLELWDDRAVTVVRNTGLTHQELMLVRQKQHHQQSSIGCAKGITDTNGL